MKKAALAIVVIALIVVGTLGYVYYVGPATVRLSVIDPPPEPYDSTILHIYITFSKVEVHAANAGNESGWHTITTNATVDLIKVLNTATVIGSSNIPPGRYNELRFYAGTAIITIGLVNVTYAIPSGEQSGFKVTIQGGFQTLATQTTTVQLDVAFHNSDILNPNHTLVPVASATVQS